MLGLCNLSGMRSTAKPTTGFDLGTFEKMLKYSDMYFVGIMLLGRLSLLSVAICYIFPIFVFYCT